MASSRDAISEELLRNGGAGEGKARLEASSSVALDVRSDDIGQ